MVCYRDMTFCGYWTSCSRASDCHRPLTEEVFKEAIEVGLPIMQFVAPPKDCYKRKSNVEKLNGYN